MLINKAVQALEHAQRVVQGLLEEAVSDRRYGEASIIASIAQRLGDLTADIGTPGVDSAQSQAKEASASHVQPLAAQQETKPVSRIREYPYFEREAEKLVKIGWSKKDRKAYEHRAPREAVEAAVSAIRQASRNGSAFAMDDVLPVRGSASEEFPTYQAYMVLAWLRSTGRVRKLGNDGYKIVGHLGADDFARLWSQLPSRD